MEHLALANQYFLYEAFEEAADSYTRAIGKLLGKDQFAAVFGRAKCRIETGSISLAISDLQECVSLDPKHQLANYYLGYYLMKQQPSNYKVLHKCKTYLQIALNATSNQTQNQTNTRFQNALDRLTKKLETIPKPDAMEKEEDENTVTEEKQDESVDAVNATLSTNNNLYNDKTNGTTTSQSKSDTNTNANVNENEKKAEKVKTMRDTWYQSPTTVTYTLYVKNLTKDDVCINFETDSMLFELNLPNNEKYNRKLILFGAIVPQKCKYTVNKFKINCVLQKAEVGEWKDLEKIVNKNDSDRQGGISAPWTTKKNWDKVSSFAKEELDKEKPEGDEALQSLFQKIYADADEDQRRAMVKSFQTSGGTVLSTNWGDVKNKDYEGKDKVLPTGQDVRKWEY